jgi:putative component of toxin-antitoxin plasmid stabilization module
VEEYIRPDGRSPYADWFDGLDAQAAAKVTTAKLRMELGNTSNVKWFAGIAEYKARNMPLPGVGTVKKRKR